ncbi:hypothetical protein RRF57_003856 [Xylaria bambusicola]|uniref:SprT-like domain-containing protein n=1 Tax=Xylaria bambusicola TaxID=326684 RepID=A0AAN7UKZ0_9PEZI
MTSPTENAIKTLEAIADRFFRITLRSQPKSSTSHDAKSITRLVETNCLAVLEPKSAKAVRFVERCRLFLSYDMKGMERSQVEAIVNELFSHLDGLFFFGLLGRQVSVFGGETRPLVKVEFLTKVDPNNAGSFNKFRGAISICLVSPTGLVPVSDLLFIFIHEMVHAWLEIFSDANHPEHYQWVKVYHRHGEMFRRLFRFVAERVGALVPSDLLQGRILVWLNKLDWQVRRNSGWWDCFVSAVTL